MKPSLYLETTIPSFLVGGISPNLLTAAHQEATKRWWDEKRGDYEIYISTVVYDEISRGGSEFSRERDALVSDLPRLAVTDEVTQLADELHAYLQLPPSARPDATHIALACHYKIDYMLTWNLKHIASAHVRHALVRFHDAKGIAIPTICTPEELLDWRPNDERRLR